MAATRVSGQRVTITTDQTLHTGAGRLMGFMASSSAAAMQTITFEDGATVILTVYLPAALTGPYYVSFAVGGGKLEGVPFSTSLIANKGAATAELNVWYEAY